MDNNISDKKISEYQEQVTQAISEIVVYLRELLKVRSKDFVLFRLDEIAKESNMEDLLKDHIKKALDDPENPFTINFKKK